MDDGNEGPQAPTGRLHGRLLGILAVVSVAAAVAAVWLFSPMMFQGEEETAAIWPWEESATVDVTVGEVSAEASPEDSPEASISSASPEASSAEPDTEPPPASSEPAATTEAAEPEPEPEGPECTASLRVTNEWWQSGEFRFEAWVEVVNTGADFIDDWEVVLAFDGVDVHGSWGMEHEGGDRYESDRWNSDLEPGQSADAAFQATADDEVDVPDTVPCTAFD